MPLISFVFSSWIIKEYYNVRYWHRIPDTHIIGLVMKHLQSSVMGDEILLSFPVWFFFSSVLWKWLRFSPSLPPWQLFYDQSLMVFTYIDDVCKKSIYRYVVTICSISIRTKSNFRGNFSLNINFVIRGITHGPTTTKWRHITVNFESIVTTSAIRVNHVFAISLVKTFVFDIMTTFTWKTKILRLSELTKNRRKFIIIDVIKHQKLFKFTKLSNQYSIDFLK